MMAVLDFAEVAGKYFVFWSGLGLLVACSLGPMGPPEGWEH